MQDDGAIPDGRDGALGENVNLNSHLFAEMDENTPGIKLQIFYFLLVE